MRNTRILSVGCWNRSGLEGPERLALNRKMVLTCLDRAGAFDPDFVVFPEIMLQGSVGRTPEILKYAEPVPGPMVDAVGEKARQLNSHVIIPLLEQVGNKVYNSAVLVGRDGNVIGVYHKFRATGYEIEGGVQPGEEVPVWETDRGRVGCAICFDLEYDDVGLALSRGKAHIVFWPTMFSGGRRIAGWCMTYGFYMVKCAAAHGCVVDPMGRTLAIDDPITYLPDDLGEVRWTFAEINTDFKVYHPDFNREYALICMSSIKEILDSGENLSEKILACSENGSIELKELLEISGMNKFRILNF